MKSNSSSIIIKAKNRIDDAAQEGVHNFSPVIMIAAMPI